MTKIEFAPEVQNDFDRILNHLAEYEGSNIDSRIEQIISAIDLLAESPFLGRPRGKLRELVIGKRTRGYIALYDYDEAEDLVVVLAIKSQREAGYSEL